MDKSDMLKKLLAESLKKKLELKKKVKPEDESEISDEVKSPSLFREMILSQVDKKR
jgi:hypothetical protein